MTTSRQRELARKAREARSHEAKRIAESMKTRARKEGSKEFGRPKKRRQVHLPTMGLRLEVIQKAQLAMKSNFAFPCAMCHKLHRNIDRGYAVCEEKQQGLCSGPLDGQSFPLYEGPLDSESIASHCFRCGMPESADRKDYDRDGVFLRHRSADGGVVGLCSYHKAVVDDPMGGHGRLIVLAE